MVCTRCNSSNDISSKFCGNCGAKLEGSGTAEDLLLQLTTRRSRVKKISPGVRVLRLLPVIVLLIAAAGLYIYSSYKSGLDKDVDTRRLNAEKLILEGRFDEANGVIDAALKINPRNGALLYDREIISKGKSISGILKDTDTLINRKKFDDALNLLHDIEGESGTGVFSGLFRKIIDNRKTLIKVLKLGRETEGTKNCLQLGAVYGQIKDIDIPQARKLSEELRQRIIEAASNNIEAYLSKRDFTSAIDEATVALRYLPGNPELLDLKQTAENQRESFEKSLKDRSSAVLASANVLSDGIVQLSFDSYVDDSGYINIKGSAANISGKKLEQVRVIFKLYDSFGNYVDEVKAWCHPNTIADGESANFTYVYYELRDIGRVRPTGFEYGPASSGEAAPRE